MAKSESMKATAGTKIGGSPKRGPGMKLFSDFKGVGANTKKATKQSRKAV